MEEVSPIVFLATFVVIVCFAVLEASRQTLSQRVECPQDSEEREVLFEASTMEPDRWNRVVACGPPDSPLVQAGRLRCNQACQRAGCHARMRWTQPVLRTTPSPRDFQ